MKILTFTGKIILTAIFFLVLVALYSVAVPDTQPPWITEQECSRLMKYHGVSYLRIGDDKVEIYRDGWITVKRRGE